jgi:hypothetical protein
LPDLERLDGTGRQLGAMLAQELSLHDLDPIAALEPWRLNGRARQAEWAD